MPCAEHDPAARLQAEADRVAAALRAQDERWGTGGWTRRRFLAGAGMAGVAALGSQLVTTRVAFAAPAVHALPVGAGPLVTAPPNTVVTIFLRGGLDWLHALVPATSDLGIDHLRAVRPSLVPADGQLVALPGASGWAVHQALQPLVDGLWSTGELAFVPAVSTAGVTRSHFQAQQLLEKGGSTGYSSGWLDRVLHELGPGTTFRALAEGSASPASFAGDEPELALDSLAAFAFPGWTEIRGRSQAAVSALYRGMPGTVAQDVATTVAALGTAARVRAAAGVQNGAVYPAGRFSAALKDLAAVLRAEVGLQVATVDVGGWDTHTDEAHDLDGLLSSFARSLMAFLTDLGPVRRRRVTVVVMSEFGRRVEMNASGGTDHGHGGLMWLLGGGLNGAGVHGSWTTLSDGVLDDGDVPGWNDAFDVLGELAQKRLGVGTLANVFPGHTFAPLGVARTGW